jgi:hypothetical protein
MVGLKQVLETSSLRELRALDNNRSDRSWYRLIAMEKKITLPAVTNPLQSIQEALQKFEPLKLVDFQNGLINNDKYN